MRHSRPHLTWVKRALVASATALGLAAGLSALPVAMAAPAHAADTFQSVTVTHTGTAPTGYTVTFKYQAPAGTQAVSIYGEWAYGTPNRGKTALGAEHTTASWADGDVPYGDPWDLGYQDMTVGPDNVWSITLPLPGGTFSYGFYVGCTAAQAKDGTQAGCTKADRVSDPGNVPWSNEPAQVAAGAAQQTMSQVYVPEDPSFDTGEDTTYQQASDSVAHGTLQEVTYAAPDSVNPAGEHRMVVYLPPNYSASGTAYPTLYISHGGGGNETDWVTQGSANIIMDNAIAAGKATPAVMVFTNFNDLATSDTLSSTNAYRQHLINTVIPYVEAHYNVSKDASERAFAGLSAGGSRANNILQNSADEFGYYGVWSINSRDAVTDEAAAKLAGVKAIQFGCGLEDMACGATGNNHAAYQTAQAINYRAAVPGLATVEDHVDATHSWYLWRHLLNNFVRTVAFKDISVTGTAPTATVNPGVATRLTATVGAADVALGGTVAFYAGDPNQNGTKLGSADVDASGEAAVTASFRETGSMGVYAQFTPANGQLPVTVKLYDVNVVQPTGAIVSYTGKAPTGYQVTFRYQGGSDVSAVSVSGEWAYEPIAADGASLQSPSHGPADWQAGDVLSGNQSVSMVKGNDGVWQVTMPMTAGEHSYSFSVTHQDGTRETVADPANLPWSNQAAQVQAGASQQTLSQFYVPNDTAYPTYDRDFEAPVPASEAGTLEEFSYASTEDADGTRDATVWLPPSYDADASTPYPTLYLSHGSNGSETDWATQGDAVNIIARAIADQKMQPTVVVMTNGNDELMDFDLYAANLKDSLIPAVEANFNVSKDVSERAYGGLSAGGRRGIVLLENYTDLFSYYGIWSAYTTYTDPTADQAAAMDKVDAVHIGAGIEDTSFGGINVTSHKRATGYAAAGVAVDEHNVDGVHSWDVWRQELNDYVRNVAFKGRYSAPVNPLKLGPTITKTDQGPTGYEVTFRFQAPAGTSGPVSIYGEWGLSTPVVAADGTRTFTSTHNPAEWKAGDGYNFGVTNNMTLTSDNVWEWTTPLPSGTFSYRYNYNCHATSITYNGQTYTYQSCDQTTDPYNVPWSNQPAQAAAGATPQAMSQIYVPESSDYPTVDNSFQAPVPTSDAGTLISLSYNSLADKATGETHQATVYLPKGYNASRATPYPTLYISHGAGGSDTDWVTQGQIQNIVQNAIDQHAADPMVVVVPNFETWLGWNQDEIADELQNYLIPVIEHNYNVSTNPAERAFAGLSMGGLTTVHLLENNTALFGYYGAMSQAAGVHTTLTDTQIAAMKQVKGLMMGVGYEDTVTPYANTVDRVNYYRSLGLQVTTDYMDGVHCWDVWRHLADYFIRNIAFKPQAAPNPNPLNLGPAVTYTGQAPTGYSVTFRFQAPAGADSVSISGDWGFSTPDANGKFTSTHTGASWAPGDAYNFGVSNPMTQGSDGVWSWTTPLPAGTFNYSFTYSCSDGSCATTSTPDPQNLPWSNTAAEIAAGAGQQANSQIYVPESSAFPTYDAAYQAPLPAAEAGTLQTFAYYSKNDQATRYATVWLPPDYDGTRAEGYPTLYISHGGGGDDTDWATQGVAQNIVENEIQAGNASDMVIVMPNINMANGGSGAVGEELGGSLIPAIESHFNVSTSKDERAFAGLSMGAMAGTTLIQGYTDLFGYYGLWSGASVPTGLSAAQLQALKGVKGLMIGAGNQDPLGTIQKDAAPAAQAYADDGVPTVLHMVNGVHCWDVWRQMADYFVKYVAFRPGGPTNGTVTPTPSTDPTTDPTTPATDPTTDPAPSGAIAAFAGTKAFTGKAATGYTLTAPAVSAQPGVALSYRWYVGGTFVSGVATSTYKVRTSDVGERVRVRIVASDDATSVTLVSNQTAKVAKTAKPTIKGTAKAGATLTAVPGSWTDGTTFTYKWTVGGAVVQTGTGASYQVAAADAGQSVKVTVTGKLAGYATVARASAAKAIKG